MGTFRGFFFVKIPVSFGVSVSRTIMAEENDFNWTVELEVSLFHAMRKHKPVGNVLYDSYVTHTLCSIFLTEYRWIFPQSTIVYMSESIRSVEELC